MASLGCSDFAGFEYADGDSLFMCVFFTPKEEFNSPSSQPVIYSPEWYLSDEPVYNVDMDRCNFLLETLNQVGTWTDRDVVIGGRNFGGCEASPFFIRETVYYGGLGFDEFCGEIRIPGIPEKYIFVKPPEFQFCLDNFRFQSREFLGPNSDQINTVIPSSFLNVIGEDTICFFAKNYMNSLGLDNLKLDEGNRYLFFPCIQGNCESEVGNYRSCSTTIFDVDDKVYCQDKLEFAEVCENWTYTGGPVIDVNVITPVIELFEPGGCARVQIRNTTNIPAPFSFLNIDDVFGGMVITSVTQDPDGAATLITPTSLGIYQLGLFPAGTTIEFEICANVTDCEQQQLAFTAGWDCVDYPTTVEEAICSNPSTADFVTIPGGFDASLISPVGNTTVELCDTICYNYSISSTQLGNIQDILFQFKLPTGINFIPNSLGLAYPISFDTIYNPIPDPNNPFDNIFSSTISDFRRWQ